MGFVCSAITFVGSYNADNTVKRKTPRKTPEGERRIMMRTVTLCFLIALFSCQPQEQVERKKIDRPRFEVIHHDRKLNLMVIRDNKYAIKYIWVHEGYIRKLNY